MFFHVQLEPGRRLRWADESCALELALLTPTFWGFVLFPAAVLLILWGAIHPEEQSLNERFGTSYEDYSRRGASLALRISSAAGRARGGSWVATGLSRHQGHE